MTGPRRWPVHPAPIDGETLSSWLHRIAACYGTDLNVLGDDLGLTLGWRPPEDIDVAATAGMIEILAERTGVTPGSAAADEFGRLGSLAARYQ